MAGRPRSVPTARCPKPEHKGSSLNQPTEPGNWVRINEAARLLGTTTHEVTKAADDGELTRLIVGTLAWFNADELDASQPQPAPKGQRRVPAPKNTRTPAKKQAPVPLKKQTPRGLPRPQKGSPPSPAETRPTEPAEVPEPPTRDPNLRRQQPPGHHPGGGGPWTAAELDAARQRLAAFHATQDLKDQKKAR